MSALRGDGFGEQTPLSRCHFAATSGGDSGVFRGILRRQLCVFTMRKTRRNPANFTWWPQRDFHFVGVLGACEHGGIGAGRAKAIASAPRLAERLTRDASPAEEALQHEASLGSAGAEHAPHIASQGLQARREPRASRMAGFRREQRTRDRARPSGYGTRPGGPRQPGWAGFNLVPD